MPLMPRGEIWQKREKYRRFSRSRSRNGIHKTNRVAMEFVMGQVDTYTNIYNINDSDT